MKITSELLKKYASGKCTEAERLPVEQWLSDNEDLSTSFLRQKLKEERARVWQSISATLYRLPVDGNRQAGISTPGFIPGVQKVR